MMYCVHRTVQVLFHAFKNIKKCRTQQDGFRSRLLSAYFETFFRIQTQSIFTTVEQSERTKTPLDIRCRLMNFRVIKEK